MRRIDAISLCLALSLVTPALGQANTSDEVPVEFKMSGKLSETGMSSDVRFELVTGEVRSVRVYTEPSHRLVGAFVNNSAGDPEGQGWYRAYALQPGDRIAQVPLVTGTKVQLQAKPPAEGDDSLQLVVDAVWPNENVYRERTLRVMVGNLADYTFTLTRYAARGKICCSAFCGQHCTLCPGDIYRCCYQNGCAWCGEARADCEQGRCPTCS